MRAARRMLVVLATTISVGHRTIAAQNAPITWSVSHPDWVSAESFSSIVSVRVLSSGMVLAVDGKELEVQLLDASGKTIRQIGRKGSGPAEYSRPTALIALPHDTAD
ncbi:MAG: hypothetical protein ABI120_11635 [Gemmatimonadaceae bacterium]